jgi:2-desacetyl-2-hydroxyethyl bacteriochlorophyllide A dehydrogenase
MQQIIFNSPGKVSVRQIEDHFELMEDDILLETEFSIVSAGTELAILSGGESWATLPYVPGYGSVGIVAETGNKVRNIYPGDRVFTYGKHASHSLAKTVAMPVPKNLNSKRAVFLRMAAVSITSLRCSQAELGDYVTVFGMGLVGNLAAQLFSLSGCEVIAVDRSKSRLEKARKCGIRYTIDASPDIKEEVHQITGGEMCRTVVDATGIPAVAVNAADYACAGGELILLGSPRGRYETDITPFLNKSHLWSRGCITIKGAHEWRYPIRKDKHRFFKHSIERNLEQLITLISDGRLYVDELLTHEVSPGECYVIYDGIKNNQDDYLGVVFNWKRK